MNLYFDVPDYQEHRHGTSIYRVGEDCKSICIFFRVVNLYDSRVRIGSLRVCKCSSEGRDHSEHGPVEHDRVVSRVVCTRDRSTSKVLVSLVVSYFPGLWFGFLYG